MIAGIEFPESLPRDVLFSALSKENVTKLVVIASGMIVPEINIQASRWRGLARLVGSFLNGLARSYLHREPVSVLVSQRVNIFAGLDLLQRRLLRNLWSDLNTRLRFEGLARP